VNTSIFAYYSQGVISSDKFDSLSAADTFVVDVRNEKLFLEGHIKGAINIEWLKIIAQKDELPKDKMVVLYCDTGILSSRAQFILHMIGFDNAKVLFGGYSYYTNHLADIEADRVNKLEKGAVPPK